MQAVREAVRMRTMFNVIDTTHGWKADLIVRKDRPFSVEEFRRRRPALVRGHAMPVASPEDVILTKLEWNRLAPSEQQLRDVLNVAVVQWANLDLAYLRQWAASLGVTDLLEEILRQAYALRSSKPSGN